MTARRPSSCRWPLLLALLLAACLPSLRRATPAPLLARRLVLALDGIDYRDIVAARERGLFAGFHEPSRLISTFPSISDIAWHEIFRVQAPRGYQRIFYSAGYNDVVGAPLDAIRPIEFEDRMDMAFGAKFHHLGAYLISNTIARREVDVAVRDFLTVSGRSTVYVYNVGPDALQHTRGDLVRYLEHLDQQLTALDAEYRQRTGRSLEIVVLSDHGHNRAVDARFLPVVKALEARGFHTADRLRLPTDVAFSVDGVTTGFGVFAAADSVSSLSRLLASVDGVDLVSERVNDDVYIVRNATQDGRIDRRAGAAGDRYRYVPLSGDPLGYAGTINRMQQDGAFDDDGFADAPTWVRYTASARYPAAVVRIVRGHTVVTLNPAPILVSIADSYRVGLGMVSIANRMRPLGGTHGALSNTNSLGVVMTNFRDTRDDLTTSISEQFDGFADLGAVRIRSSSARLTSAWLIGRDQRSPFTRDGSMRLAGNRGVALEVSITGKQLQWADGRGILFIDVRRSRRDNRPSALVGTSYLPMPGAPDAPVSSDGWIAAPDRQHYLLPLSKILVEALEPNTSYDVRIILDRIATSPGDGQIASKSVATLSVRTNANGELWPY
ncbi:MAG: hypothetical protein IPP90_19665 [Gemmatimonadaceae bacterium]|nr:hypothetical protein [Gemmatimonadaceae bacterium]